MHKFQTSLVALVFLLASGFAFSDDKPKRPSSPAGNGTVRPLSTIPAEHKHVHALAENAMWYIAPQNGSSMLPQAIPSRDGTRTPSATFPPLVHAAYRHWPVMELCANVAAGYADTPYLSREEALKALAKLVGSLRRDQHDPTLSAKGLLVILDLGSGQAARDR